MSIPQWRRDLRSASFRGVPFLIQSSEREGGRRGVTHEFAQRDKPFGEDTGRMARKFQIDAYVIGQTYFTDRDKLIEALETDGPGELIHPYYGRQVVDCFAGYRVRETSADGGMAVFNFTLVEHGEEIFPDATKDAGFLVEAAAAVAQAAASAKFQGLFGLSGLPGFVFDDATAKINTLANALNKASGGISANSPSIADFAFAVRKLKNNTISLLQTPSLLAQQLQNDLALLRQAGQAPGEIYKALQKFFGYGDDQQVIPTPTATRFAQQQNSTELYLYTKAVAVSQAALVATQIDYVSTEDALKYRNQMLDCTDDVMRHADDTTYQAFQDLRSAIVLAVPPQDQNLASVTSVQTLQPMPSLVLAYDIYGDVNLENDLILRNNIAHPGVVPAGVQLEVLQLADS